MNYQVSNAYTRSSGSFKNVYSSGLFLTTAFTKALIGPRRTDDGAKPQSLKL